ncbi:hypothetical protein Tco_0946847 [Tanacetum coccineum]
MGGSIAQTRSQRVPTPPHDSPLPRVHTLRSDEGSMTLQELTLLCITLSKKLESLEVDLKQTKQVYDVAYTKLIMKGEDQPEDQLGVLSAAKVLADAAKTNVHTYTRRRRAVSTGSGGISTAGTSMPISTADKGRASELATGSSQATIIDSAEVGSSKRAVEAELDHEDSKRQNTNEASGSVQEQPEEEEKELSQEDLQQMMMVVPVKEVYVEALQDMLKIFDRDDLVMLWNLVKERFSSSEPIDDKKRALWVELKRLFVEQHSEMANELLRKIFIQAN